MTTASPSQDRRSRSILKAVLRKRRSTATGKTPATAALAAAVLACADPQTHLPVVRVMDGHASEGLRRSYHVAARQPLSREALEQEAAWIDSVAAPLESFWAEHGERILGDLADFTGEEWVESSLNVYLVRQPLGVAAFSMPLVLDLSPFVRVAPSESDLYQGLLAWALVHELVHRLLDQRAIARGTTGTEAGLPGALRVAGSVHDWDDVMVAFVLRDALGEEALRPLLFNRGLQRSIGLHRLDRIELLLERWRPSREQPLRVWLQTEPNLDTGVGEPAARAWLEGELHSAGPVPPHRVRHAAQVLREDFGLTPEETAQLLSDWEGTHGAGRLGTFPYRRSDGWWEWA
ncbi:MAG: hypothetical protein ABR599_12600 [Gemmatimonadota bacterium]